MDQQSVGTCDATLRRPEGQPERHQRTTAPGAARRTSIGQSTSRCSVISASTMNGQAERRAPTTSEICIQLARPFMAEAST